MSDCQRCGDVVENKNEAGHYRQYCCRCWLEKAGVPPENGRPFPGCTCDKCKEAQGCRRS